LLASKKKGSPCYVGTWTSRPLFPSCSSVAKVVPPGIGIVLLSLNTTQLKRNTVAIVEVPSVSALSRCRRRSKDFESRFDWTHASMIEKTRRDLILADAREIETVIHID
jgi:hypothetical protein